MTTPAWQAIQPELVPREQFPAAASLRGVTVDAARAIGPPIAGLLVAAAGPEAVFAINAVPFVTVVAARGIRDTIERHIESEDEDE